MKQDKIENRWSHIRISDFREERKRTFNEILNSTIFYIILHVIGYMMYVTIILLVICTLQEKELETIRNIEN